MFRGQFRYVDNLRQSKAYPMSCTYDRNYIPSTSRDYGILASKTTFVLRCHFDHHPTYRNFSKRARLNGEDGFAEWDRGCKLTPGRFRRYWKG